jgi:CNT family concentrative nucleoside transporter
LFHNNKYISQKPFKRAIASTWGLLIEKPWDMMPYKVKLIVSWVALLVLFLGSAFGIPATEKSPYKWRAVGLAGIVLLYGLTWLCSVNRKAVKARTTILGLGFQMILGLFVFKTDAGLDLFTWVATLCADFLRAGSLGGGTFFWRSIIENGDFATNTLSSIIFFVAFATALYYSGVMSWVLKKFGWVFAKSFGLSGAESIVAAASPFIGQGENCILGESTRAEPTL